MLVMHTGMEGRVDKLLGLPQLGSHGLDLTLLVGDKQLLGLLETSIANEKGPEKVARELARCVCRLLSSLSPFLIQPFNARMSAPTRRRALRHVRQRTRPFLLPCLPPPSILIHSLSAVMLTSDR